MPLFLIAHRYDEEQGVLILPAFTGYYSIRQFVITFLMRRAMISVFRNLYFARLS